MADYEKVLKIIKDAKRDNLTKLDLSRQRLTEIPKEVFELNNLTELDLSGNQLTTVPEEITKLSKLTIIKFGDSKRFFEGNRLKKLPEAITKLSQLTHLDLSNNELQNLPDSIRNLDRLTELCLSNNKLQTLPESITNLPNLIKLNLRNNHLKVVPESIAKLSKLEQLYLRHNQLQNIPAGVTKLSGLIKLDLEENQLSDLPKSITNLTKLINLDLKNNQLENLPASITQLPNLTQLILFNNPLENPPIEIASRGIEAIKEYFRQLEEQGKDYFYEAKLLILGQAGAGKTTLAKNLQNPNYGLQTEEKSTEGIDVIKWNFNLENNRDFKVNIWDFGGQEIYHSTHQFFLTKRSLYVLVLDNRKENDKLEYWLNLVERLSDNSPLIIVQNEKEDRVRRIDEKKFRRQFGNLQETLVVNLKTKRGLDKIRNQIKNHLIKLDHIGTVLPKTWVKVRQALESDSRNYINLQEYFKICENHGLIEEQDQLQLSRYLHDLGVCLHFQDDDNSRLYSTIILKPEWGTDAVYKVLDNTQVIHNQGFFTSHCLKKIWNEKKYSHKRGELLELMKKFELCYEIYGSKDNFIAPQLLSFEAPDYDWDNSSSLVLKYQYLDFMPKGIITRFIVVMHEWIDGKCDPVKRQCVWLSGVVLKKDETRAEVIENYSNREIKIRVNGKFPRDLMTKVAHELDRISDSFHELKYQKLIPCNCDTCKNSQDPHSYDYQTLREMKTSNIDTIRCSKKPFYEVEISGLIDHHIDREISESSSSTQPEISSIASASPGQQEKSLSKKFFTTEVTIGLVTMFLTIITILFNGVFTDSIRDWIDSFFSRTIPESHQERNQNIGEQTSDETQLDQDQVIKTTSPSIP